MQTRRQILGRLGGSAAALAGLLVSAGFPEWALAVEKELSELSFHKEPFNLAAFTAKTTEEALQELLGSSYKEPLSDSDGAVLLKAPDVAENGAIVEVQVSTNAPKAKELLILADKNPSALAARFFINDAVEADFKLRMKLSESTNVYAAIITEDGRVIWTTQFVKVVLSGCIG